MICKYLTYKSSEKPQQSLGTLAQAGSSAYAIPEIDRNVPCACPNVVKV